ncbi:hypothetical protein ASD15_25605 [Massilia sp. Root351]|jgi:hypothetical protein|uniref:DUF3325 domain-containing protein n=1 Tax=Massilia sp. Root351 TaxID=1736522 RepID=UPI0007097C06|nr:DUF3325 domain-containing protein [Massilia sp. Root351]KQV90054.1 hypothetical protein ASD15_25605 [Massilia sp. Root351]
MMAALQTLGALALCYAGMAALALAMDRHHQQWRGRDATPLARSSLRVAGALLLAAALLSCSDLWGVGAGVVGWTGFLTAGALILAFLLPYGARLGAALAPVSAIFGLWTTL